MIKPVLMWSAILLLSVFGAAAIAQDVGDALRTCALEKNDAKRLACYDGVAGRKVEQAPVAKTLPKVETPKPAPSPIKPVAPAPTPVASNANAESTFGLSAEQMQKPNAAPVKQIASKVAKIETRARGRLIVTLENDQVWEQLSPDSTFLIQVGDPVTIKTGALGAYYLYGRSNRTTNVRRMR